MPSDVELLQQAHGEVNRRAVELGAVEVEHGRGRSTPSGDATRLDGGADSIVRAIRQVIGVEDDEAVGLLLGGIMEQATPAHEAVMSGAPVIAALVGAWVDGFAHGKRFAELREEAARDAA